MATPHHLAPQLGSDVVLCLCVQCRGSLHAHILLWVEPEDAERVASEITATRCRYKRDEEDQAWVDDVPRTPRSDGTGGHTDVLTEMNPAERLLRLVDRKQLHKCRKCANGCRRDPTRADGGPCRYGFPFEPNHTGTVFDTDSNR